MGCETDTETTVRPIWSNGTTTDIFIPFVRLRENEVGNARLSFLLAKSAGLTVTPATRGSKDGYTYPDAPATWTGTAAATADGWTWGTAYTAPNDDYQEIEFGFNVKNTSGGDSACNAGLITLVLDVRK